MLLLPLLNLHCGYRLAGQGRNLPAAARTVAISVLVNETANHGAAGFVSAALKQEFLNRSRLRLSPAPESADLLLEGKISAFEAVPVSAGRWQLRVGVRVRLIDLKRNELVYDGKDLFLNAAYAGDANHGDPLLLPAAARDKLAATIASGIVSAILDNF